MIPGPMNFHVIRYWSYTEPDPMMALVSVWHRNYQGVVFRKSMHVKGGWNEWFKAGYPIEEKSHLLL